MAQGKESAIGLQQALDIANRELGPSILPYQPRLLYIESQQAYALWLHHASDAARSDFFIPLANMPSATLDDDLLYLELASKNPSGDRSYMPRIVPDYVDSVMAREVSQPLMGDFKRQGSYLLARSADNFRSLIIKPAKNALHSLLANIDNG